MTRSQFKKIFYSMIRRKWTFKYGPKGLGVTPMVHGADETGLVRLSEFFYGYESFLMET